MTPGCSRSPRANRGPMALHGAAHTCDVPLAGRWMAYGRLRCTQHPCIYVSTVAGIRASERRTLAEMSAFDFVVAVALGSVVGRTATASDPSYIQGATVIVTLVAAHRLVGWRRIRSTRFRRLLDRPSVILIDHGRLMTKALRRAHLTDTEVYAVLRQHGVAELDAVELLVLEGNGRFSVRRRNEPKMDRRLDPSAVEHG